MQCSPLYQKGTPAVWNLGCHCASSRATETEIPRPSLGQELPTFTPPREGSATGDPRWPRQQVSFIVNRCSFGPGRPVIPPVEGTLGFTHPHSPFGTNSQLQHAPVVRNRLLRDVSRDFWRSSKAVADRAFAAPRPLHLPSGSGVECLHGKLIFFFFLLPLKLALWAFLCSNASKEGCGNVTVFTDRQGGEPRALVCKTVKK